MSLKRTTTSVTKASYGRQPLRGIGMASGGEVTAGIEKVAVSRKRNHNGQVVSSLSAQQQQVTVGPAPFHTDPQAQLTRDNVDYTVRFTLEEAKNGVSPRPLRVYADGIYDMFHTGHARQLMQAKMAFPNTYLIVGVCSDEMTHKRKGRTVNNEFERYEALRHCRYVDEVVTDAPWTLDMDFLTKHKIDFVAHDELPYTTGSEDDVYKFVKECGMFLPTERTEGISTTDVITRIIKDYDVYVRRNLSRGYSPKDLNVSYMKAKRLKIKENYEKLEEKLKDKGKVFMATWKESINQGNEFLHKWEEKSKEFIGNFVEMFGRNGKMNKWFTENTLRLGRAFSPSSSPVHESPPSPSSDQASASPPHKRSRFAATYTGDDDDVVDDDDDDEDDVVEDDFTDEDDKYCNPVPFYMKN